MRELAAKCANLPFPVLFPSLASTLYHLRGMIVSEEPLLRIAVSFQRDATKEYAVTADMARQYKALQEDLIYKINSLEMTLTAPPRNNGFLHKN